MILIPTANLFAPPRIWPSDYFVDAQLVHLVLKRHWLNLSRRYDLKTLKKQRGSIMLAAFSTLGIPQPAFVSDPFTVFDSVPGGPAQAGIEIDGDGGVEAIKEAGNQGDIGRWDNNLSLTKSDYQFRLDTTSGTLNAPGTDPADTWLTASTGTDFFGIRELASIKVFSGTLRVRPSGGGADFDTASVSLSADTVV